MLEKGAQYRQRQNLYLFFAIREGGSGEKMADQQISGEENGQVAALPGDGDQATLDDTQRSEVGKDGVRETVHEAGNRRRMPLREG